MVEEKVKLKGKNGTVVSLHRFSRLWNLRFSVTITIIVFWDEMPCYLEGMYQHFRGICCLQFQYRRWSSRFIRNIGTCLSNYMALQLKRQ
jgi:hypothetical protein